MRLRSSYTGDVVWFALVVIAVAGLVYVTLRYWSEADLRRSGEERSPRRPRLRRATRADVRPFAPDDDEEFLRELDRRRLHGDE